MEDEDVEAIEVINEETTQADNEEGNMSVTGMEDETSSNAQEPEKAKSPTTVPSKPRKRQRSPSLPSSNPQKNNSTIEQIEIKSEPDDYDSDGNVDIESVTESELLINPMALATNKDIIEPDSTQKLTTNRLLRKKKTRGPKTHFRGAKVFKKKCPYCQIHLHSKFSYTKHMERYHHNIGTTIVQKQSSNISKNGGLTFDHNIKNIKPNDGNTTEEYDDEDDEVDVVDVDIDEERRGEEEIDEDDDDVYNDVNNGEIIDDDDDDVDVDVDDEEEGESIEDVEDELVSMEKNAPLTQVQETIISQLKTFSCYSCQKGFNDRRSTLNHIRQHMPDLRPYTCIACLTEFPDRSIYKLHCGASFECAMKIALVTPKHGTEKYFTCNMCLRPLHNRKDLLSHLSKHSDRQFEQLTLPQKLKTIQQQQDKIVRKQENNTTLNDTSGFILGPYKNGDPAHNHTCIYCGMIYKYKPNMIKHQELCKRLPPDERNSYHCADCGMTFLVFKKFQSHIHVEHQRKDTICYICGIKYKLSHEFLLHHQKHRKNEINNKFNNKKNDNNKKQITKYGCPLCPDEFLTRTELQHHKTSHLKLKNNDPPLTIDDDLQLINNNGQQSFSSSLSLSPPPVTASASGDASGGIRSTECRSCGKIFANYPNLRRHIRTAHIVNGRFCCPQCPKTFTSEDLWVQHGQRAHPRDVETPIIIIKCQQCKKVFDNNDSHAQHLIDEHGIDEDDHLACDICGKRFSNETSLKIHRGHHFRRDSRLSIRNIPNPMEQVQVEIVEGTNEVNLSPLKNIKSPSSSSPIKKLPISPNSKNIKINNYHELTNYTPDNTTNLQCAVCDDNFNDVHDLRKHLWDVHCAKNKIENTFTDDDLQCELCTNILPDVQSFNEHMKWHKDNPILSDVGGTTTTRTNEISCDICGKFYSSIKSLTKHQKLHKTTQVASTMKFSSVKKNSLPATFACPICKKAFNNENSMKKHKAGAHYARRSASSIAAAVAAAAASSSPKKSSPSKTTTTTDNNDFRPKRPKLDFDVIRKAYNLGEPSGSQSSNNITSPNSSSKKSVTCGLCKKVLPSMSSLYKHRQNVHKISTKSPNKNDNNDIGGDDDGVQCSDCFKIFSNSANMRQHYTKVHGNGEKHYCTIDDCNEEFDTSVAKQLHEKSHMSMLYSCNYCGRYMFNRGAIDNHLTTEHPSNINDDNDDGGDDDENIHFKKIDLSDYEVKGADGRVCPVCLIKYPNIKAMKIHYVKIHEGNS